MRRGGRLFLLLGILIIAAGALIYFVISQPQLTSPELTPQPTQELKRKIVIARIDIPNNTVLTDTETFLGTADIPEAEFNSAAGQYFTSPNELLNKQTLRQINFNERIRKDDVTDPGLSSQIPTAQANRARVKAITFQVNNLSGVADQIKPGDFVDVLSSFIVKRTFLRPGFNEQNQIVIKEDPFEGQTTKTLLQNVQVLRILKPAPVEGTPTPGGPAEAGPPPTNASGQPAQPGQEGAAQGTTVGGAPNAANTFQQGNWLLVLAVTDQQAEILKFSLEQGTGLTLVLRGRGDSATETTIGATLDLLVSQFGLPLPQPAEPAVAAPNALTPVPTSAPAAPPAATPTPR
ncbi:MAG TPA: Flp pilus assembly protein CpaB [Roseiflexaceae bacterium]